MKIDQKYHRRAEAVGSLLCVGLDSDINRLPERFLGQDFPQFSFNRWIIEQTHPYVSAYKPNTAFYESRGEAGWRELRLTLDYLHDQHPDIVTICDAKRGDIGSTSSGYVTAIFDNFGFDAVTLNPYLGKESLQPFLERDDKACIILCRTSNPGAGEFQNLVCKGKPLWQIVAEQVRDEWNGLHNCMLVVGATVPDELGTVRQLVGDMTLLVPGIGTQGGEIEPVIQNGINAKRGGLVINVSRAVIFSENPQDSSLAFRDKIYAFARA